MNADRFEPSHMSPDHMMHELAAGLRAVIEETDEGYVKEDPEDAFVDLACRLVLKLSATLAIVSKAQHDQRHLEPAAERSLGILTRWLASHPDNHVITSLSAPGKFQIGMMTPSKCLAFFRGESVQDAYAQVTQIIELNGGTL